MVATTGSAGTPSEDDIQRLADELDASPEQIREAIAQGRLAALEAPPEQKIP